MQTQRGHLNVLWIAMCLGSALLAGCGNKEPEPNAKGYDAGPAVTKGASGKTPGGLPPGEPAASAPR